MRDYSDIERIMEAAAESGFTIGEDEADRLWANYEARDGGSPKELPVDFLKLQDIIEKEASVLELK